MTPQMFRGRFGIELPPAVSFRAERDATVVFRDVRLPTDVDAAVQAMERMWGSFPTLDGGIAADGIYTKHFCGAGGVVAFKKRRSGDRLRWERLRLSQQGKMTTLAATGELGEFAGASEIICALFCDPATLNLAAIPEDEGFPSPGSWTEYPETEVRKLMPTTRRDL